MSSRLPIALATGALLLSGCSAAQPAKSSSAETPDAIGMMMVAFEGYPSRMQIEAVLDPAMDAVGLAKTEPNRAKAGSALVALRKNNGTREMDILRCMPSRSSDPRITQHGYPHDFASVAAVCSVDIVQGRYATVSG